MALVAAARAAHLHTVSQLLASGPRLRPTRQSRMGANCSISNDARVRPPSPVPSHNESAACNTTDEFATEASLALSEASAAGHIAIVRCLLERHADPSMPHGAERWTAYHSACANEQPDCVEALVRAGCDQRMEDAAGRTGAQLAEQRGCVQVLRRLAGPLAELRRERLQAKKERRRVERRKRVLLAHALQHARPDGLFLEFGVASGASINFIASRVPAGTKVHGFDSFQGLPEEWRADCGLGCFDREGELPPVLPNVVLHVGWFAEVLPGFLRDGAEGLAASTKPSQTQGHAVAKTNATAVGEAGDLQGVWHTTMHVSFLHIDCDLYSSAKTVLMSLAPAIHAGTIIVFDEYCGYDGWEEHEARAWAEFCDEYAVEFTWIDAPDVVRTSHPAHSAERLAGPSKALTVTSIRHQHGL
ncbi:hypothetical protein AB1Y20_001205 [Prymnesium parvum]|uniref:Uncharacterized protein n=1 Tax=Prymnesium parvum TaxID=97485 RepID=A0AB34K710_PRYPA